MKYLHLLLMFLCPLLFFAQGTTSYTIETVPNPKVQGTGYVSDPAGILPATAVEGINATAAAIEAAATAQIAVVVLPSIGDQNPKDFSTALFEQWGIGQADRDNGLLILTVMDQRRTEFETGYGMEGVLPDIVCYRIGMQELVPHFQEGKYGEGLLATVQRFQEILQSPETVEEWRNKDRSYGQERRSRRSPWPLVLLAYALLSLLAGLFLLRQILLTQWGKDELYDKYKKIQRFNSIFMAILFPVPCLLIFFWARSLLKKLRNHPRYSKANGKLMRKLREEEEDMYLEKGQISEEDVRSVDYDVWITDNADDILILRYEKRFSKYSACPSCRFKTYYQAHSEVLRAATYDATGARKLTFSCKNCNYVHAKIETIPMMTRSSSGNGGSGGGGSSWGGGRSGGGGAGVSW